MIYRTPPPPPPSALSGPAEELLLVVYANQLDRGEDTNPSAFAWREWADAAGLSDREAMEPAGPLGDLVRAGLAAYADPDGSRIRLSAAGVFLAESSLFAEPAFVERHKALRRRILEALARARGAYDFGGVYSGRTVRHLAAELREPTGNVLANCRVLAGMGLILAATAGGGLLRIADGGLQALSSRRGEWPLD